MNMFTPRNKFTKSLLTAAILSSLVLVGCGNNNKPAEQPATENKADTTTAPAGKTANQAADATEKLNAYVDCGNHSQMAHRSYGHYSRWVKDMAAGPTGKESAINGTLEIMANQVDACTTKLTEAVALTPALGDLDKAASELATAFKAFAELNNKAHAYYEQQNYKDDDFAQGKSMHPEFVKAYETFKAADEKFSTLLDAENNKAQTAELAKVEQAEGKKYTYWSLATSMKAKAMVDVISQEKFDAEKANALVSDYETHATELKNYINSKASDVPAVADIVVNDLDNLVTAAKKRVRRVRDNEAYTQAEIGQLNAGSPMVDGSEANVVHYYNAYIQKVNNFSK